jgi:hypothetical protein
MNASNIISGYTMLNAIKPKYFQTEYPYKRSDIIFTKNTIKILVKNQKERDKKFKRAANSASMGGSVDDANIIIYY